MEPVARALPRRTKFWHNKPATPAAHRRRFSGVTVIVDTLGQPATITPYLDNVALAAHNFTSSYPEPVYVPVGDAVGRDLWVEVTCSTGCRVYGADNRVLEEYPPAAKGVLAQTNLDSSRYKAVRGLEFYACSLGQAVTIKGVLDGVETLESVSFQSSADLPKSGRLLFTETRYAYEIGIKADPEIELFSWRPFVDFDFPLPSRIWDSGFIELDGGRLHWLSRWRLKVMAAADLVITVNLDGVDKPVISVPVSVNQQNKMLIYEDYFPRGWKAKVFRCYIESTKEFSPVWFEIVTRGSGPIKGNRFRIKP